MKAFLGVFLLVSIKRDNGSIFREGEDLYRVKWRKAWQSLGSQGIRAFLDEETKAAFLKGMEKGEVSKEGVSGLAAVRGKALAVRDGRSWGAVGQASRAQRRRDLHCNAKQTQI